MGTKGKFLSAIKRVKETRKATISERNSEHAGTINLDLDYYRARYSDLSIFNDKQLERHWHAYGFEEGRYASAAHEEKATKIKNTSIVIAEEPSYKYKIDDSAKSDAASDDKSLSVKRKAEEKVTPIAEESSDSIASVDLSFYLMLYPDLKINGIKTQSEADAHFEQFGKKEGRASSLACWAKQKGLPLNVIPYGFSLDAVLKRCSERGVEVEPERILNTLLGQQVVTLPLAETPLKTHEAYLALGKHFLACQQRQQGRALLEAGLSFAPSAQALELLGNSYLDEGHTGIALNYYDAAAQLPNPPQWVAFNRANCLARRQQLNDAIEVLSDGIASNPNFRQQYDELDRLAEQKWNSLQAELLGWVDAQDRHRLIQEVRKFASTLYKAYLPMFGGPAPCVLKAAAKQKNDGIPELAPLGHINDERVLIVGDFHVPQCERYRINQKIEQLEAVGKKATAINWTDLHQHSNALAFHDVVIFYRVPAVPSVIKAIAQVNATGKLSLYEIDDLIFEPEYPPAIDTYGGYVDLETYRGLTRGMALFNAAARLCRQGIASTEPLRKRLQPLVQEQRCLLHRNGLDHLNQFRIADKTHKKTIDIFYGSGTQAHNSDFIEQALPAIEKVLSEVPRARLVVVGYLRLPKAFRAKFAKQFTQLPAVKSVQGYWSLLEQADINIAVLHDDAINACKSELKWFEAACFSIPSVVSNTANYRDVINDGEDAFLATTIDEWYRAIKRLAANAELRKQIGQAAMLRAKQDYSLEILGQSLVDQLEQSAVLSVPRKRKLALINVFFPPQSIGGATRVVADNFSALRQHYKEDLDVCVFTADVECRTPHEMTVYEHQDSRVYRATTLWREHMDWHPKDQKMYELFSEFLALEQPDIIHFHCVQRLTASIVEAARDAGIPYIVTAHDAWWISDFQFLVDHNDKVYPEGHPDPFEAIELPANITREMSIERGQYLKSLLFDAHQVVTVSNAFAEIYRQNGIADIKVTRNGISDDVPWAPKETGYTSNVVGGHIGGMSAHKGYYLLKEAVMDVQPDNMEFLVVDHSKEEGYELHTYWGKVPVTFIGRVSQDKIVDLYRRIDVLFAPSMWPESFGLVTREAAACCCWVVASNLGGIGEDVLNEKIGFVIGPKVKNLVPVIKIIDEDHVKYKGEPFSSSVVFSKKQIDELFKGFYI